MNIPQNIQQIDDLQVLKEKILKIDSIFALVGEKQRKIAELENKCKDVLHDKNLLEVKNTELLGEIEGYQTGREKLVSEYEGKLLEVGQKLSLLQRRLDDLKNHNRKVVCKYKKALVRYKRHLAKKNQQYRKSTDDKYSGNINKLRKTIKYLRKKRKPVSEKENDLLEECLAENKKIHILQNILIKPTQNDHQEEKDEEFDLDLLLNEMIIPDLLSPFNDEVLQKDVQTQTTRSTVTRPVQTDSLSTLRKETQTLVRSFNIDVQCNWQADNADFKMLAPPRRNYTSQSIQTEVMHEIKNTQTISSTKSASSQTNMFSAKKTSITLKQAVAALKASRKTFTISNGMLMHYSKNPIASSASTNEALIAKAVFRRLTKYVDSKYFGPEVKKRRGRTSNILRELKQLERSRALMELCRSGMASGAVTSDTESSGYESRALQNARRLEDLLMDGPLTPSMDSGISSEVESTKARSAALGEDDNGDEVSGILDEMLDDLREVISPLGARVEDGSEEEESEPREDQNEFTVQTAPSGKKRTSKRSVNRMAMLRRGIKKCNQIKVLRTPASSEKADEVYLPLKERQALSKSTKNAETKKIEDLSFNVFEEMANKCNLSLESSNLDRAKDTIEDHSYYSSYDLKDNKSKKLRIAKVATSNSEKHYQKNVIDMSLADNEICPEFDSLCSLDVAENVTISWDIGRESDNGNGNDSLLNAAEELNQSNLDGPTQESENESTNVCVVKRKRGRPRKIDSLQNAAKTNNEGAKIEQSQIASGCIIKRKRGRPRNVDYLPKQSTIVNNDSLEVGKREEVFVEIARKPPVNRMAMLKRGIKKCNKINVVRMTTSNEQTEEASSRLRERHERKEEERLVAAAEEMTTDLSYTQNLNKVVVNEEFQRMKRRCMESNNSSKQFGEEAKSRLKANDILALLNNVEPSCSSSLPNCDFSPKSEEHLQKREAQALSEISSPCIEHNDDSDIFNATANFYSEVREESKHSTSTSSTLQDASPSSTKIHRSMSNQLTTVAPKELFLSTIKLVASSGLSEPSKTYQTMPTEVTTLIANTQNTSKTNEKCCRISQGPLGTPKTSQLVPNQLTTRSGRTYISPVKPSPAANLAKRRSLSKPETLTESQTQETKVVSAVKQAKKEIPMDVEEHLKEIVTTGPGSSSTIISTFSKFRPIIDHCIRFRGDEQGCAEEIERIKQMDAQKLVDFVIQYLKMDRCELDLPKESTDPILTVKQKVVLGLLVRMETELENNGYISQLISSTEKHLLFNPRRRPDSLEHLARFYTALCRLRQQKKRVRVFIADLLYHDPTHKFVIIFTIVTSWLNVLLPYKNNTDVGIGHVLAYIAMTQPNTPTEKEADVYNSHDTCVGVLKNLLVTFYKFPKETPRVDDLMMALIESYMCGGHVQCKAAILILAAHSSAEWTYGKVQLIAELCKVSADEEVERNLLKLIEGMAKKIDEYKMEIELIVVELTLRKYKPNPTNGN